MVTVAKVRRSFALAAVLLLLVPVLGVGASAASMPAPGRVPEGAPEPWRGDLNNVEHYIDVDALTDGSFDVVVDPSFVNEWSEDDRVHARFPNIMRERGMGGIPTTVLPPSSRANSVAAVTEAEAGIPEGVPSAPAGTIDDASIGPQTMGSEAEAGLPTAGLNLWARSVRVETETGVVSIVAFRNEGPLASGAFDVTLRITDSMGALVEQRTVRVGPIESGEASQVSFPWTVQDAGTFRIAAIVDSAHEVIELNEGDNVVFTTYVSPRSLLLPAETYVLFARAGELVRATAAEVEYVEGVSLRFFPAGDAPEKILVYLPWLDHALGAVGSDVPFELVELPDGRHIALSTAGLDLAAGDARLSAVTPGSSDRYTLGATSSVRLEERPMIMTIVNTPGWRVREETRTNANGTWKEEVREWDPRLGVDFAGLDHDGQRVSYNKKWLASYGIRAAAFEHENGMRLNVSETPTHYIVNVPHFSTVYTFDTSNEGFTKETDRTYSDVGWDSTNGRVRVYVDRRDNGDEVYKKALPEQFTAAKSFTVSSRWRATSQGNWHAAYPIFLAANSVTSIGSGASAIFVQYNSRDSNLGQQPEYQLVYRSTGGTTTVLGTYSGTTNTEYRFRIDYVPGTRVLTMEIRSAADVVLFSRTHTVGTGSGADFALDKFGTASHGAGLGEEPKVEAWTDHIVLDWGGGNLIIRDDDGTSEFTFSMNHNDDTGIKRLILPANAKDGATSAKLWVFAKSGQCGATGENLEFRVNDQVETTINPCNTWSSSSMEWKAITVTLSKLTAGVTNKFQLHEVAGDWTDRNTYFGVDQTNDFGRSDIVSDGTSIGGELMWYLEIVKTSGGGGIDENFDDGVANGWTLSGLWHVSSTCVTAASAPNKLAYNQDSTCTYDVGTTSGEAKFSVDLAGVSVATLTFDHRFTVESYGGEFDVMRVQVSTDGSTWTTLLQWDSRNSAITSWTPVTQSLDAHVGGTRWIRFHFDSKDGTANNFLGWLVDNVKVTTSAPPPNNPPTACFTVTPTTGTTSTVFSVDAACSSDQETPLASLQVRWDWENDGVWDTSYSTTKTATKQYSTSGAKTIRLEVKDGGGLTATTTRDVTVNNPPTACFTATPANGNIATVFQFDGSCTTDDLTPVSSVQVRWDFENDGVWDTAYSTTKTASKQYSTVGVKTIKMEAKDDGGLLGSTTRQVTVGNVLPVLGAASFSPERGTPDTRFDLTVRYSDFEGNAPQYVRATVGGSTYTMSRESGDTDYAGGVYYHLNMQFPVGSYSVSFSALDGDGGTASTGSIGTLRVSPFTYFNDEVESGTNGWSATGQWHRVSRSQTSYAQVFSGDWSWWFGNDVTGTYESVPSGSRVSGTLTSPNIDLRNADAPVQLTYMSWYETESVGTAYDRKWVEISRDGGAWTSIETIEGYRDHKRWYPRAVDLSSYVGSQVRVRFQFDSIDGNANNYRGWFVDNIAVGTDSDTDGLPDYVEDRAIERLTTVSGDVPVISSGTTAVATVTGLDRWGFTGGTANLWMSHPDWSQLTITLKSERNPSCTIWNRGSATGEATLIANLVTACGYGANHFKLHQKWWVEIVDHVALADGNVIAFYMKIDGKMDAYDRDTDNDALSDGYEVLGYWSSPLSQDIDDDNMLDGHDARPWTEDEYPEVHSLDGLNGDFRSGIRFRIQDNIGFGVRGTLGVWAIHANGNRELVTPVRDTSAPGLTYTAAWPLLATVVGFVIQMEDDSYNRLTLDVYLKRAGALVLDEIDSVTFTVGGSIGGLSSSTPWATQTVYAPTGTDWLFAGKIAFDVVVILVAGGATLAAIAYDAYVDNQKAPVTGSTKLADVSTSAAGTLALYQSGWDVITRNNPGRWASPAAFEQWVEGISSGNQAVVQIGEGVSKLLLRGGTAVVALVIGGGNTITDAEYVEIPLDSVIRGATKLTTAMIAKIQMELLDRGLGSWWSQYPLHVLRGSRDRNNDCEPAIFSVYARDGKDSNAITGRMRTETHLKLCAAMLEGWWAARKAQDHLAEGVYDSAVSWGSINVVRQSARLNGEQVPGVNHWFWGAPTSTPGNCPELDRRRCDEQRHMWKANGETNNFRVVDFNWQNSPSRWDAMSIAAQTVKSENECFNMKPEKKLMKEAQDGLSKINTGLTYASKLPVGVSFVDAKNCKAAKVYLLYAENSADHRY